jgi:hypothetical protein
MHFTFELLVYFFYLNHGCNDLFVDFVFSQLQLFFTVGFFGCAFCNAFIFSQCIVRTFLCVFYLFSICFLFAFVSLSLFEFVSLHVSWLVLVLLCLPQLSSALFLGYFLLVMSASLHVSWLVLVPLCLPHLSSALFLGYFLLVMSASCIINP